MRRPKSSRDGLSLTSRDRNLPKYTIAVASDLSGVPQQQLRRMEEGGLVAPTRTEGNTRRYSDADLTRIAEVSQLAEEGINSAGIRYILLLRRELDAVRADVAGLRRELDALREVSKAAPARASMDEVSRETPPPLG